MLVHTIEPVDLTYLSKYGSKDLYEIPSCLEKIQLEKDKKFNCRVSTIYDPSKFWIVINFKELECFQVLLFRFYYKNFEAYRIPLSEIREGLYCMAYTSGDYYRGIVLNPAEFDGTVKIFFFDYAMIEMVECSNLFYISENFIRVPKFAIRATLFGVCPLDTNIWTAEHTQCFLNLVFDKVVEGILVEMHYPRNVLEIRLNTKEKPATFIHQQLSCCCISEKCEENTKGGYLYLFPDFEALENGLHPFTLANVQLLMDFPKQDDLNDDTGKKKVLLRTLECF